LSRRETTTADADVLDQDVEEAAETATTRMGRPTPKRRDSQGKRGPVSAPRTRKEAYARQKQLAREQKAARASAKPRTVAEQRAALKRGDPDALPRRDQGKTKQLARDYVDSHRMVSNYLLVLFPVMILGIIVPIAQLFVLVVFLGLMIEWYLVGRRIRALALERFGEAQGGNLSIGFYAGSRAYLPRKWRLPAPQVERGDPI
jgi:Flp pilus assembly protein TadB